VRSQLATHHRSAHPENRLLPIRPDAFALPTWIGRRDEPSRLALCAKRCGARRVGNDRMLRVFRIGVSNGREGSLLASVALDRPR